MTTRHYVPLSSSPDWAAGVVANRKLMLGEQRRSMGNASFRNDGAVGKVWVDGGSGWMGLYGFYGADGAYDISSSLTLTSSKYLIPISYGDPTEYPSFVYLVQGFSNDCGGAVAEGVYVNVYPYGGNYLKSVFAIHYPVAGGGELIQRGNTLYFNGEPIITDNLSLPGMHCQLTSNKSGTKFAYLRRYNYDPVPSGAYSNMLTEYKIHELQFCDNGDGTTSYIGCNVIKEYSNECLYGSVGLYSGTFTAVVNFHYGDDDAIVVCEEITTILEYNTINKFFTNIPGVGTLTVDSGNEWAYGVAVSFNPFVVALFTYSYVDYTEKYTLYVGTIDKVFEYPNMGIFNMAGGFANRLQNFFSVSYNCITNDILYSFYDGTNTNITVYNGKSGSKITKIIQKPLISIGPKYGKLFEKTFKNFSLP